MQPTPTVSEATDTLLEQVARGLPGAIADMILVNPLAWLGLHALLAATAALGVQNRRLDRQRPRAGRRRRG